MTPALYPLQVQSWPSPVRGDAPVFWIIERQTPKGLALGHPYVTSQFYAQGGCASCERPESDHLETTGEVSFAILGPYPSEKDAADGLVREVGRRDGFMLIECSYCKRVLGAVHCLPQFSRLTSHGTCSSCNAELRARLGIEPEEPTDA